MGEASSKFCQLKVAAVVLVLTSMLDTLLGRVYCVVELGSPGTWSTSGEMVMLYKVPGIRPSKVTTLSDVFVWLEPCLDSMTNGRHTRKHCLGSSTPAASPWW